MPAHDGLSLEIAQLAGKLDSGPSFAVLRSLSAKERGTQSSGNCEVVMDSNDTLARLKRLLVQHFGRRPDMIAPDATLCGDLMLDGLDMVDLVFLIHREFEIQLTLDPQAPVRRVRDLVSLVEQRESVAA